MFNLNFWRILDSNRGPLELEATALSTEPQPLPIVLIGIIPISKITEYRQIFGLILRLNLLQFP